MCSFAQIASLKFGVSWRALFFKPLTGLMHIKLYLFRFTNTLRVVVCSANPTVMSWSFQRENIWVQDFPVCRDAAGQPAAAPACEFGDYLRLVAEHMRMTANCQKTFGLQCALSPHATCVDFGGARARLGARGRVVAGGSLRLIQSLVVRRSGRRHAGARAQVCERTVPEDDVDHARRDTELVRGRRRMLEEPALAVVHAVDDRQRDRDRHEPRADRALHGLRVPRGASGIG